MLGCLNKIFNFATRLISSKTVKYKCMLNSLVLKIKKRTYANTFHFAHIHVLFLKDQKPLRAARASIEPMLGILLCLDLAVMRDNGVQCLGTI